jgi:hypothetical protein
MQSTPFSTAKLDALLDESGIDLLLVTSKHNLQYLLGGYRYYFFEHLDNIGLGRYLPVLGYVKGQLDRAFYVGSGDEGWGIEVFPFWPERISTEAWNSAEAARIAATYVKSLGIAHPKIGLELEFWTANAWEKVKTDLPDATFVDSSEILQELRAAKTPDELDHMRKAATAIVDSMVATFHWIRDGNQDRRALAPGRNLPWVGVWVHVNCERPNLRSRSFGPEGQSGRHHIAGHRRPVEWLPRGYGEDGRTRGAHRSYERTLGGDRFRTGSRPSPHQSRYPRQRYL